MQYDELKDRMKEKLKKRGFKVTGETEDRLMVKRGKMSGEMYLGNLKKEVDRMAPIEWDGFIDEWSARMSHTDKHYKKGKLTFRFKNEAFVREVASKIEQLPPEKREDNKLIIVEEIPDRALPPALRPMFERFVVPALETDEGYMFLTKKLASDIGESEESLRAKWKKKLKEAGLE